MNPCTLMGGFLFEAGRALFGASVIATVALVTLVPLWLILRRR